MSGKGSKARPFSVTQQEYESRWDAIFGRDLRENEDETFDAIMKYRKDIYESKLNSKEDCMTMEMPGTIGSAKIVFKQ